MAGTTPRYSLPYQEATDPPNGATLGQDLATAVETALATFEDAGHQFIQRVTFTASGAFTKASYPNAKIARVRVVGGAGAGGGAQATGASTVSAGGGGQAGAYAESILTVASLATSVTVTVGTGGAGVSAGNGSDGTSSSFGTHVVAPGGKGGIMASAAGTIFPALGGGGAQAMTGDIQIGGAPGHNGYRLGSVSGQVAGGAGGSGPFGGGGWPGASANGQAGVGYGSGGGGVGNSVNQTAKAGGAGANGVVIVDLYG